MPGTDFLLRNCLFRVRKDLRCQEMMFGSENTFGSSSSEAKCQEHEALGRFLAGSREALYYILSVIFCLREFLLP